MGNSARDILLLPLSSIVILSAFLLVCAVVACLDLLYLSFLTSLDVGSCGGGRDKPLVFSITAYFGDCIIVGKSIIYSSVQRLTDCFVFVCIRMLVVAVYAGYLVRVVLGRALV